MSQDSDSLSEEEPSLFRPFTRESLVQINIRIAEEYAKQKELEKKRAEGEVNRMKVFLDSGSVLVFKLIVFFICCFCF